MHISILEKKPTWELKAMVKALSLPVASFLNTEEDNKRLEDCKKILKEREKKTKKTDNELLANSLGLELSDFSDDQADLEDFKDMLEGGI